MRISVVGTGYVGLVTGACFADKGHQVICVDVDAEKVERINRAVPPIYEKGLPELLEANVGKGLSATTDLERAVAETDVSFISVGTPFDGKAIDLSFLLEVSRQIGKALRDKQTYHLVVVKSTVVPGTTEQAVLPILEETSGKKAGADFGLGMNPEFLREGEAVADSMYPDRIVLGGIDERSIDMLAEVYGPFAGVDLVRANPATAEMIKYTANSMLAMLISFSNEIANLCSAIGGIDVVDVMRGVHLDKRLTPIQPGGERVVPAVTTYLQAGCGFGGSCFPKDVRALISHGRSHGQSMSVLGAVMEVNDRQPGQVVTLLERHFPDLKGLPVAVLGLAFKPGTDDMRESAAIPVIHELLGRGAGVRAYDPVARQEAAKLFDGFALQLVDRLEEAIEGAKAIIVLTGWPEFERIPELLEPVAEPPVVIDGRRMLDKKRVARYEGIGL